MKAPTVTICAALCLTASAQGPLALRFVNGETLRYRSTMRVTRSSSFKGETNAIEATGTHTITVKVTSATADKATMSVTYSGANATAKATSLAAAARSKKAEIEKGTAEMLKKSLEGMTRTQTVSSSGNSTYTLPLGDGKSMTIEDGAFMMLILPKGTPTIGQTWTANVRTPDPTATGAVKMTYKFAGPFTYQGVSAVKITLSSTDSKSQTEKGTSAKMTATASGYLVFDPKAGKLRYGEVKRVVATTVTRAEGTQTTSQTSVQTYSKT